MLKNAKNLVWILLLASCGQADFKSKRNSGSAAPDPTPSGDIQIDDPEPTASPQPSTTPPGCVQQKVLILDFMSGWLGSVQTLEPFTTKILQEIEERCRANVLFEYHHVAYDLDGRKLIPNASGKDTDDIANPAFTNGAWTTLSANLFYPLDSFTQVFFFSGSSSISGDIAINHPYFQDILSQMSNFRKGFWIGASAGAADHVNALLEKLKLSTRIEQMSSPTGCKAQIVKPEHFLFKDIKTLEMCSYSYFKGGEFAALQNMEGAEGNFILGEMTQMGRRLILDAFIQRVNGFDPVTGLLGIDPVNAKLFGNLLKTQ